MMAEKVEKTVQWPNDKEEYDLLDVVGRYLLKNPNKVLVRCDTLIGVLVGGDIGLRYSSSQTEFITHLNYHTTNTTEVRGRIFTHRYSQVLF